MLHTGGIQFHIPQPLAVSLRILLQVCKRGNVYKHETFPRLVDLDQLLSEESTKSSIKRVR
jgi:hypothetical protein